MSTLTAELPKEVTLAWRKHLGTSHGQYGVDWLRRNGPKAGGTTDAEVVRNAYIVTGYQQALDDIEDRLTALPVVVQSLDEPTLR